MARFLKDRSKSKGQAPGSLILIGQQQIDKATIKVMDYDKTNLSEFELQNMEEIQPYLQKDSVTWINVYGIHDLELIRQIGDIFQISSLFLEDILNTDQMPKYEDGLTYDAFILKMLSHHAENSTITAEQVTLILGERFVLTLQEKPGDVFTPVRERIRNHKGRVRLNNNDYLAYALMDTIVDNYLISIEFLGRKIEDLEPHILKGSPGLERNIYRYKTELNYLRKNIRPVKEMMHRILKSDNTFFEQDTRHYLNDLNDLVSQTTEAVELYSSMISDQLNTYNTIISNKMNQVMKVLTIFGSLFIPLTFIAGVYGMNFAYMPELGYKYSYPIFWGIIVTTSIVLLLYFKRKQWL